MKITIQIPDEKYEQLEAIASGQKVKPETFLVKAFDYTLKFNPIENQIVLNGKQVSDISQALGGKTIRSADDIVKLMKDNFRLSVAGVEYALSPEDAYALKAQYEGMGFTCSFEDYCKFVFADALSLFLYGSTSGKFAYV